MHHPAFALGQMKHKPLQHSLLCWQKLPPDLQPPASALFASPKQASAMPARPRLNFFSAARRVADWARLLVSSSNWLFIAFLSFGLLLFVLSSHGSGGFLPSTP